MSQPPGLLHILIATLHVLCSSAGLMQMGLVTSDHAADDRATNGKERGSQYHQSTKQNTCFGSFVTGK